VLEEAEPERLRLLGYGYVADDRHVYYRSSRLDADAGGFVVEAAATPFAVDTVRNKAFVVGRELFEVKVDAKSFQSLAKSYYKDAAGVYYHHLGRDEVWQVKDADPATFVVLDKLAGGDAKDRFRRYFMGEAQE
jgi:hypothetical protein